MNFERKLKCKAYQLWMCAQPMTQSLQWYSMLVNVHRTTLKDSQK